MSDAALVLDFAALASQPEALARVGGKGANLGILAGAGFPVPPGFCLTTAAFRRFMAKAGAASAIEALYAGLDEAGGGAAMRTHLEAQPIPPEIIAATLAAWRALGSEHAYAVRSSATAEDLPGASFAGQQDTYLNIVGEAALLDAIRRCWASLFTDRAIAYRRSAGFSHRAVELSVVVQRMVLPQSSGVLFTADPLGGKRGRIVIDASFGLGEALVSGQVNPDHYEVDQGIDGEQVQRTVADKQIAILPLAGGGTERVELDDTRRHAPVLDDARILELAALGRRIEAHFGTPQDVEWCFEGDALFVVQSRPITTLFPLPEHAPPGLRVYLSFGHAQVMTDAMPRFALDVWRRVFPVARDQRGVSRAMRIAGNRLFVDPSDLLRLPALATRLPKLLSIADREISAAVAAVAQRPEFAGEPRPISLGRVVRIAGPFASRMLVRIVWRVLFADTGKIGPWTREVLDADLAALDRELASLADTRARLVRTVETLGGLLPRVALLAMPSVAGGVLSGKLLTGLLTGRVDAEQLAALDRGLPGNVTTQMDLAIGDLAEQARAIPSVAERLRAESRPSLADLEGLPEARPLLEALEAFLDDFGARGASEIDISRPRWRNEPGLLLQVIRGNLLGPAAPLSAREHHRQLQQIGDAAVDTVAQAARWWQRPLVRRLARAHRALFAMREHPKFQLIRVMGRLRELALAHADALVAAGSLEQREQIWLLHIDEVLAAEPGEDLRPLIRERQAELDHHRRLSPPRVMTSEGEIVRVVVDEGPLPEGALRGLGVSAGVVEGVVKVVLDPHDTAISTGEILVAPFTDPGWTPLFINAAGLVM
ncbi:MAG: hypothetical protein KC457_23450, partial [Myxococcales bacterium]|nr:hypothetical protein [Myxococcales bacterium]